MKYTTLILTYLAYASLSFMRMSFPFVQYDLALYLNTDEKYLGIITTICQILIGIGFFIKIFFPYKKLVNSLFWQSNLLSLFLISIPVSIYLNIKSTIVVAIFFALFGIFQAGIPTIVITLVKKKFTTHQDGCILGFWASSADIGSIIGLMICTIIVYYINGNWKLCLVVSSLLNVVINIFFKCCLD